MWICPHCHAENKDGFTVCETCGAPRSAGRFAASAAPSGARPPQISAPAVQAIPARYTEPGPSARQAASSSRCMQGVGKCVGWALIILLPLLTALLAWRQYDVLQGALVPLLADADASDAVKLLIYMGWALVAVLLSLLPGLHTLLQCPRYTPRRKKRKK